MPTDHQPKVRLAAATYFLVQGIAVFLWWAMLFVFPGTRGYFVLEAGTDTSLMSFWLPDVFLLGAGSLAASWLCFQNSRYLSIATWFVTGAVSYATIYSFSFTERTDVGWLGIALMFPAMIWSGVFSVGLSVGREMFRRAKESRTNWIVAKTIIQIVVVWSIILIIFPYLITIVEDKVGIPRLHFSFQQPLSIVLFVVVSSLGVWSAVIMSRVGRGTPLPLDHASRLVAVGPYAYVRNPMAVSGIGQGFAVALFLGSPFVTLYALMGSLIWQLVFRPLEEDDLADRFGDQYREYCRNVKCWFPRTTAYQIDGAVDSSNSRVSPLGRM